MKKSYFSNPYLQILLGTILIALSINWFFAPNGLVTGGIAGIGIILQTVSTEFLDFTIPVWVTNIVLNIPLFAISIKQRGCNFAN